MGAFRLAILIAGFCYATGAAAQPRECAAPTRESLLPAVDAASRAWFDSPSARALSVELDGAAPAEAVLAVARTDSAPREGALVAFRCTSGRWSVVTRHAFSIDEAWDGTFDGTPGFEDVAAMRVLHDRDFVRVVFLDLRGGADPRFVHRAFVLLALQGDQLERVFDCGLEDTNVAGPARAGRTRTRTVALSRTAGRARLRVTSRSAWDEGTGSGAPADGLPRIERTRRTNYTFDGRRFVAPRQLCGEDAGNTP